MSSFIGLISSALVNLKETKFCGNKKIVAFASIVNIYLLTRLLNLMSVKDLYYDLVPIAHVFSSHL